MVVQDIPTRRHILGLLLSERSDPDPYYRALATRTIAELPVAVDGASVIDLGCGSGHDAQALQSQGAHVVSIDIDPESARRALGRAIPAAAASALAAPFGDHTFDGAYCSNVLEHVPCPQAFFDELARLVRPGGWAWVSWTNWYSPWGGHNITPLHYLGPDRGLAAWSRLFGAPTKNVPGEGLFVTKISSVLDLVNDHRSLDLVDAWPRYYPSQRWVLSVPGLREVVTWNCALWLQRR